MNITQVNTSYYQNRYQSPVKHIKTCTQTPSFEGMRLNAASEKVTRGIEYPLRLLVNRLSDLFEGKNAKAITKSISEIKPESNESYLNKLEGISRLYATDKSIDVNIEDEILENIAKSNKSVIFIMNHSNQNQDPSMLAVLNSLLTGAYKKAGKENDFPIPKIILNKDILTSMNKTRRKAFESFGAVGVDANLYNADKKYNVRAFLPIIKDFIRNKCNIFIFPEGKLAVRKDLDLESRFQSGIAELINKVLGIKKEVTVVPVGFSYGKGQNKGLNGMQIGIPVTFKRDAGKTTVTKGSVLNSEFADDGFKSFFASHKDETDVVITEKGLPVQIKEAAGYIKSLLSENLNICSKEALKKIQAPSEPEETLLI